MSTKTPRPSFTCYDHPEPLTVAAADPDAAWRDHYVQEHAQEHQSPLVKLARAVKGDAS